MQERTIMHGDGAHTAVLEAGEGGRPLLLVHGFTGRKDDFTLHVEHFAEQGWWVVAPDLRGHGGSHRPEDEHDYHLEAFAADLADLVGSLRWDRYVLLGHSMGGMIAQVAAIADPSPLDGLVLMNTSHGPIRGVDRTILEFGAELARSAGMAAVKEALDSLGADAPLGSAAYERYCEENPGHRAFADEKLLEASPVMYARMLVTLLDQDDRLEELASIEIPTLVVVGDEDVSFLEPSTAMADAMPDSVLSVIPDAGHSPQFENASAWRASMDRFLGML